MLIPYLQAQFSGVALMYSGPLSQRIAYGLSRQVMICVSTLITQYAGSEKSASMPSASQLKSWLTLSSGMLHPLQVGHAEVH